MGRRSWINRVGPNCNHKCSFKRRREEQSHRGCDERSRSQSDVRAGPQVKGCGQPPEAGKWRALPVKAPEGTGPADTLASAQ